MEVNTKFVLVEGEDDLPLYESSLDSICTIRELPSEHVVVFGGGKSNIVTFYEENPDIDNFIAILDLDFDHDFCQENVRLRVLNKYSIENYFFHEEVMASVVSRVLRFNKSEVLNTGRYNVWKNEINNNICKLLKFLFYYQNAYDGDREKWADYFFLRSCGDLWKLDNNRIESLINDLSAGGEFNQDDIEDYFCEKYNKEISYIDAFPGKMLFLSFYRYVKEIIEQQRPRFFCSRFPNEASLKIFLSNFLTCNVEMLNFLYSVIRQLHGTC